MQRLQLTLPETFIFSTEIPIQISDINYGQHLSNDAVLRFAHEVRLRFLAFMDYTELDVAGTALIMADAQIQYLRQAFYGQVLCIRLALTECGRTGFTLFYSFFNLTTDQETARVSTNMVFFDYKRQRSTRTPDAFRTKIEHLSKE